MGGTICIALLGFLAIITSPLPPQLSPCQCFPSILYIYERATEKWFEGLDVLDVLDGMGWEDVSAEEEDVMISYLFTTYYTIELFEYMYVSYSGST